MLRKLCPSYQNVQQRAPTGRCQVLTDDLQEAGEVFVIGTADCGQLGLGEDVIEVLRARLSTIASGHEVRMPCHTHTSACVITEVTSYVYLWHQVLTPLSWGPLCIAVPELSRLAAWACIAASERDLG